MLLELVIANACRGDGYAGMLKEAMMYLNQMDDLGEE